MTSGIDPNNLPPGYLTGQVSPGTTLITGTNYSVAYVQTCNSFQNTTNEFSVPADRYWLSVPRRMDSLYWDVLLVNFRNPVSVTALLWDMYEVAQHWEWWYYPNNLQQPTTDGIFFPDATTRLPVLDRSLRHLAGHIDTGVVNRWYSYNFNINPCVMRTLELRVQRNPNDGILDPGSMFSVGIRNLLAKRQIYNENDAMRPLEPGVDPMGNVVDSYVRKWDATQAIDGTSFSFWKSAPQPTPDAVVSFYMDVRDASGNAQRIDRLFMDPTHTGQNVNLYYSTDNTVGPRMLNLTYVTPDTEIDTTWVETVGLDMSATTAVYEFPTATFNIDTTQSIWFAGTWSPTFNSTSAPADNLVIIEDSANQFSFGYRSSLNQFLLQWGSRVFSYPVSLFSQNQKVHFSIRIVRDGNANGIPHGIYFIAINDSGYTISSGNNTAVPETFPFPTLLSFRYSQGTINDFFIKQDAPANTEIYMALLDVSDYLLPTVPDEDSTGSFAPSSLTNMVYAVDFAVSELGYGGTDHYYFAEKVWSPIWADWTAQRGFYYFPQPVTASYLKIEFSNLTVEPYTIHESGINVEYASFPINVTEYNQNINTVTNTLVQTRNSATSSTRGLLYSNTYSTSTTNVTNNASVPVYFVNVGSPTVATTPHTFDTPIYNSLVFEGYQTVSQTQWAHTDTTKVAQSAYYTVVSGDWLIKIGARFNINWWAIYQANRSMIDSDRRVGMLPSRSPGWWIFPGQQLRIPNAIMEQITRTSTTTEKVTTNTTIGIRRARFTRTEVHRYQYRTAERDAALAYFAGLREIQAFRVDYTQRYDQEVYDFPIYDTTNFSMQNMYKYTYSGGWESSATPSSVVGLYPSTTNYPSKTKYPAAGTTAYPQAAATWSDVHHWGDPASSWGYIPKATTGRITSHVWNSLSYVQSCEISVIDRGLYQQVSGTNMAPVLVRSSSGAVDGFWDDPYSDWNDPSVDWGTTSAHLATNFNSSVSYAGQSAASLYRPVGNGEAGIQCPSFAVVPHARVRVEFHYLRPVLTTNNLVLQLVDVTNYPGENVLYQETITNPTVGQWDTYYSRFWKNGDFSIADVQCRIMLQGVDEEMIYVGQLNPQTTSIVYELSNDGGSNYFEVTQAIWGESTVNDVVFPSLNTQLCMRVTLYDPANDFVFGGSLTPRYV